MGVIAGFDSCNEESVRQRGDGIISDILMRFFFCWSLSDGSLWSIASVSLMRGAMGLQIFGLFCICLTFILAVLCCVTFSSFHCHHIAADVHSSEKTFYLFFLNWSIWIWKDSNHWPDIPILVTFSTCCPFLVSNTFFAYGNHFNSIFLFSCFQFTALKDKNGKYREHMTFLILTDMKTLFSCFKKMYWKCYDGKLQGTKKHGAFKGS